MNSIRRSNAACASIPKLTNSYATRSWNGMAGGAKPVDPCNTFEVHHKQFRSHSGDDSEENLITLLR